MHVAGYIRVSTEQQKEDGSHEQQEQKLVDWADREGHDLELYRDIAISGQSDEREAYQELMDHCEEYDAVAVRELSRFGRSQRQILNDINELDNNGTDFISLEDDFDTSTAQGTLLFQIIGAFNEFWANLARERAQEEVERRRENDEPLGRPRKLDDDQIQEVLEWHEKGLSHSAIATLVEDAYDIEVSRQTIYRYCKEGSS